MEPSGCLALGEVPVIKVWKKGETEARVIMELLGKVVYKGPDLGGYKDKASPGISFHLRYIYISLWY